MSFPPVKLSVVGLFKAGKTSIVHWKYQTFLQRPKTTIGILPEVVDMGGLRFVLWDVGGQTLRALWNLYRKGTKDILYVVDAADPRRFIQDQTTLQRAARDAVQENVPLAVLANKVDIADPLMIAELLQLVTLSNQVGNVKAFQISAKTGVGLKEVMTWITDQLNLRKPRPADY